MFKQDLQVIDQLRRDAVNVQEPHPSGIAKLTSYAAQLVWIGGKFPIDVGVSGASAATQLTASRSEQISRGILRWGTTPSIPSS